MCNLRKAAVALALGGFALAGSADTITFPDGSTMDGSVKEINENCIELTVNDTTIQFQRTEITGFEKNDKLGEPGKAPVIPMVAQWEKDMKERTGLDPDQRERVSSLLEALVRAEDAEKHKQLERDLIELNKTVDIIKFIKNTFEHAGVSQQMERLEAYLILEPGSATPFLQQAAITNYAPMRVLAMDGFVATRQKSGKFDSATVKLFARGMLDLDSDVQIAAGHALAETGEKAATPLLIAALSAPDPRVRNVANGALARIWQIDSATLPDDKAAFWKEHWTKNGAAVKNAMVPEALAPLVDRDAPVLVAHH